VSRQLTVVSMYHGVWSVDPYTTDWNSPWTLSKSYLFIFHRKQNMHMDYDITRRY